ncbi:ubiquitin fusion degradation protein 4 [[Candida] jaroonii]|uniref:Ubiquitin fusion degradation protein 4 n=1 Tax=[Candida] jaroonii TaxID=467808 RepID=A0ACA9YDL5_9ASCO|nr:ubiquitin fusion degradation protein 4 [[Candida] jaroonii]
MVRPKNSQPSTSSDDGGCSDNDDYGLSGFSEQRPQTDNGFEFEDMDVNEENDYDGFEDADDRYDGEEGEEDSEDGEDEDGEDDEDDEEEEISPHDFIGRLLQSRIGRQDDGDFFRAFGGTNGDDSHQSFTDVIQRLVNSGGGGIISNMGRDSEMDRLIQDLNQRDDTFLILETLNELSSKLLMMNGITAERVIPANKLARSLVGLMSDPSLAEELELQLVACRCLYNFLEVNQDFIHDVINNDAIETLCHKLNEITYIDLTEQALQTLEMISRDLVSHSQIIEHNGLMACLQYLDFLTIHSQRKCLTIVANACTNVVYDNFSSVNEVFENISTVVKNHSDPAVLEHAWLAISRIIHSFKSYPDLLEKLFLSRSDLLNELVQIIVASSNKTSDQSSSKVPVNFSSCISLVKSLIILCSTSVDISALLLTDIAVGESIIKALNRYRKTDTNLHSASADIISVEVIMAAPTELVSQFLSLIGYLLPIAYTPQETPFLKNSYEEQTERTELKEKRIELYSEVIHSSYVKFVNEIWSLLINGFQASMDFEVRRKVLINLFRVVKFFNTAEDLKKVNDVHLLSNLLASIVNQSKLGIKDLGYKHKMSSMSHNPHNENENQTENEFVDNHKYNYHKTNNETDDENDEEEDVEMVDDDDRDSTSKLNANISLLSSSLIMLNLIRSNSKDFIEAFEKEGLISDVLSICTTLKTAGLSDPNDDYEKSRPFSPAYSYRYIDMELTKDYEYKLTSARLYNKLLHVTCEIEDTYNDYKKLGDSLAASVSARALEELKQVVGSDGAKSRDQWTDVWAKFKTTFDHNLSSFELISSGFIGTLTDLFTHSTEADLAYTTFMASFFVPPRDEDSLSPAEVLVERLQEALTRSESFEILSAGGNTTRFASSVYYDNSQTAGMAKQIKLRLVPNGTTNLPGPMQNMVLSVHAIATFSSIDTFLKQRLSIFDQLMGRGHGSRDEDMSLDDSSARNGDDSIDDGGELTDDVSNDQMDVDNAKYNDVEFLINGEVIPNETTIYGAIYRSLQGGPDEVIDASKVWNTVHSISFRKAETSVEATATPLYGAGNDAKELQNYDSVTISILRLLKVLFGMNSGVASAGASTGTSTRAISKDKFMNWKLSVKLNRQLEEPLIVASGTLPGWALHITRQFPFMFPLDTRIFFLQSTSFGYSRLIHQWQIRTNQETDAGTQRAQLGRPSRHKVRISRKSMLQSAIKVLGLYGSTPGVLEIEYFDEVGSGLGPTLEFYSSVSKEFSKRKLDLWRDDSPHEDGEDYVHSSTGLFPAPLSPEQLATDSGKKKLYFYSMLGKFIARALLDSRIIDFKFNPLFLKLVEIFSGDDVTRELKRLSNLNSLRMVDPYLAESMAHLQRYGVGGSGDVGDGAGAAEGSGGDSANANGSGDGTLEDLSLIFTLPGYPHYELVPDGDNVALTTANIDQYINKVIETTLYSGVISQVKAFMEGFSKVFPINSLVVFSPDELVELFGNAEEDWSYTTIFSSINANHGYNKDSDTIKCLVKLLVEFNDIEKRSFLQFLTGAPKLPIGGFKSLKPELTVVRKYPESNMKDDDYLPSVMTCANYLKLPDYSNEKIMKERLLQAVNEGAGAFLLS